MEKENMKSNDSLKPVEIISDSPEEASLLFGFNAYARTIAGLIANKENKTPFTIGIYGEWGSGKTTLMKEVIAELDKNNDSLDEEKFRHCKHVWFQAWKYKDEDEILAALIEEIFKSMQKNGFFEQCKGQIEKFIGGLSIKSALGEISKITTGIDVSKIFQDPLYRKKLGFYDAFQEFFDKILWTYLNWRPKITANEKPDDSKGALVIFIDDLDRCPKERIVNVLETLKLFMDKSGCVFVIGAAVDIIVKALEERYKEEANNFMEKIVQVTFDLPQLIRDDFLQYLEKTGSDRKKLIEPYLDDLVIAMKNNPRRFKRFLNNLNLLERLFQNKGVEISFEALFYWQIVEYAYPALKSDIVQNKETLNILKEHIKKLEEGKDERGAFNNEEIEKAPQHLQKYLRDSELAKLLKGIDAEEETLKKLISFSDVIEGDVEEKKKGVSIDSFDAMVKIPAGTFKYGDEKEERNVDEFFIDVYPVTNSQYKKFIESGGYSDQKILEECWSEEGRKFRKKENITKPYYWNDEKWNQPEHPVVGVIFYEAEAYAKWAGKRLPTEEQWEKAARGTDGREYPWGDEFDKEKCNTYESKLRSTTPVTQYANGISPYGCYDMAGNVWEWTDSWYDADKKRRVLRGGSWFDVQDDARCASRDGNYPAGRDYIVGFRCASRTP